MHPEIRQPAPGACPKCGMALEPVASTPAARTQWVCPMHPHIVRDGPGTCPICGMALEPRGTVDETANPELADMTRRFWIGTILTAPLALIAMSDLLAARPFERLITGRSLGWLELILASPVVLWGGWPFFVRAWQSIVNRSLVTFTAPIAPRTPAANSRTLFQAFSDRGD